MIEISLIGGTIENHHFENEGQFQRKMTSRHLFMLSLGGVIGTGLFLSSGYTIAQAGPLGAVLSYLVGAVVVYLVMLSLGELAVAMPGLSQGHSTPMLLSLSALVRVLPSPGFIGFVGPLPWEHNS